MERHIDILEKYYEEIRENVDLDIHPSAFAAKCVSDFREKKKNIGLRKPSRKKGPINEEEELKRLGRISSQEFGKENGEDIGKSFKAIAKMLDIMRGD
tara:strand:+ start:4943 stop:5236 length:294 start_codon:yes stop_codon:yes gene_type:complete